MQTIASRPWTTLRVAVLVTGVLGALFCIASLVKWWTIPMSHRDGFELIGVVLAAAFFIALVLPILALGLSGRWLGMAAVLAVLALVLMSDTLLPWVPWHWLPGPPKGT